MKGRPQALHDPGPARHWARGAEYYRFSLARLTPERGNSLLRGWACMADFSLVYIDRRTHQSPSRISSLISNPEEGSKCSV